MSAAEETKTADVEMKEPAEAKPEEAKEDSKDAASLLKPKEPEKKEVEEDAPSDSRAKVNGDKVGINANDTTLNALPVVGGHMLTALNEGAFQSLLASVRANTGVKAGRYMFELKIIESAAQAQQSRGAQPFNLLRVGVSLSGSSVLLADGLDSAYFDSEGFFVHGKTKKKSSQKVVKSQTLAVLLNLDSASAQANTISLFRDGKRISEPQALPENLVGQTLFPTITYRNVTLQVNFGPEARVPLPFTCRMLSDAASADVEVVAEAKSSGKNEVVFPVGLPEKGYFDWVDAFVQANPGYTELSDRKLAEWATKSGLVLQPASTVGTSDKPNLNFGMANLATDRSAQKVLFAIAATNKRNFIIPELKSNLVAAERKTFLSQFSSSRFKKRATVVFGEPSAKHKASVQSMILAGKQAKVDAEKKKKLAVAASKKAEAARQKMLAATKKKNEKARLDAIKIKKGEPVDEDEPVVEEPEEAKDEPMEEDVVVELTAEEKELWYRKSALKDVDAAIIGKAYSSFVLPTADEGFDEVAYDWQQESACASILKEYVLDMKRTQRVDDITPGAWFKEEWTKWEKEIKAWKLKATDYKNPIKKKAMIAAKKAELKKAQEGEEDAPEPELPEVEAGEIDTASVEDVTDIGNCEPLFAKFESEDWILLGLRYEFHMLLHAWKKDLDDADRPSFTDSHVPFYYNKYFKKPFMVKNFGVNTVPEVVAFMKDTISINGDSKFLETNTSEDAPFSHFVKLTEEHRRDRARRVDAGDEGSMIKFPKQQMGVAAQQQQQPMRTPVVTARPAGSVGAATIRPGQPAARPVMLAGGIRPAATVGIRPAGTVGMRPVSPAPLVNRLNPAVAAGQKRPFTGVAPLVTPAAKVPRLNPTVGLLKPRGT